MQVLDNGWLRAARDDELTPALLARMLSNEIVLSRKDGDVGLGSVCPNSGS